VCGAEILLSVFAYVGGNFNNNWSKAGFFAWNCNNAASNSNWNYGARLLIYINKKILHIIFHATWQKLVATGLV
jgi:hypothetical protein